MICWWLAPSHSEHNALSPFLVAYLYGAAFEWRLLLLPPRDCSGLDSHECLYPSGCCDCHTMLHGLHIFRLLTGIYWMWSRIWKNKSLEKEAEVWKGNPFVTWVGQSNSSLTKLLLPNTVLIQTISEKGAQWENDEPFHLHQPHLLKTPIWCTEQTASS